MNQYQLLFVISVYVIFNIVAVLLRRSPKIKNNHAVLFLYGAVLTSDFLTVFILSMKAIEYIYDYLGKL